MMTNYANDRTVCSGKMTISKSVNNNDVTTSIPRTSRLQQLQANIRDSSSEQPTPRNSDRMWDALDEALEEIDPNKCGSKVVALEPVPVDPCRMRIVDKIKLGWAWDHRDPNTDAIKWVLAGQDTSVLPKAAIADPNEPLVVSPFGCDGYSRNGSLGSMSTVAHAHAPLSDALLKPEMWDEKFQELLQFREDFGHCLVPHNWEQNRKLAQWVKRQRYQFKLRCDGQRNTLIDERLWALEEIDFAWSSHHANWDGKFQALKDFRRQHGHCNVPARYPHNHQLSVWVRTQRKLYKLIRRNQGGKHKNPAAEDRFNKLQTLGFEF
jgi:hypothetical protein